MPAHFIKRLLALLALLVAGAAAAATPGRLVDVDWLRARLAQGGDVLLLDAQFPQRYAAGHIPGAVNVDLYGYAARERSAAEMERLIQAWGVSPGRTIVLYDQGGAEMAPRVFFDLLYRGVPEAQLHLLDGGLAKWRASGGAVTTEATPAPAPGTFRAPPAPRAELRVRLDEFVAASGDPARHALVEALEPTYHYGATKFFDRAGHVPNARLMPTGDFYNADKTFKKPAEVQRMLDHLGIRREQTVHAHCGGGVAAAVPFFALKYLTGYPQVKLYVESQLEWLADDRGLPFWSYDAPQLVRDAGWVAGWNNAMARQFGVAKLNIVDVRSAEQYAQNHIPYAVHVPADVFARHLREPRALADVLTAAGVNPAFETVVVSGAGLDARAALALVALQAAGQRRVSVLGTSLDDWGFAGHPLTKQPTVVGPRRSPQDMAVAATRFDAEPRAGVVVAAGTAPAGVFPRQLIAAGAQAPAAGGAVHVPHHALFGGDGAPRPAAELWQTLSKAGVSRYAELVATADDAGEAARVVAVLKLMGFADVKLMLP